MKLTISLFISILFIHQFSFSQISQKGTPRYFSSSKNNVPTVILPGFNLEQIIQEDESHQKTGLKSMRYAKMIDIDISSANDGVWTNYPNGDKIWQIRIQSPGAYSLSVLFDYYRVPKGADVFIYNQQSKHILGAFTYLNNKRNHILPVAPVQGDEIIIEYFEPNDVNFSGELHISSIGHDYKNIFDLLSNNEKSFGSSGSCNVNVNCPEGDNWQIAKKSVGKIIANGLLCSGALINNTKNDGKPYFLTANHCIDNSTDAENAIFYFNYESPDCEDVNGNMDQTIGGSEIIAAAPSKTLDFTLLELSELPPPSYSPYYAGWNRNFSDPTQATSIHHPGGDIKKITISNDGATTGNFGGEYTPNTHWWIDTWDIGTTEGGSSGSPIFDQNQRIIGDLTGGDASCSFNYNDYYQQFHHAWQDYSAPEQQLRAWLDPDSTGILFLDGYLPYDSIPSNLKVWAEDTLIYLKWNEVINNDSIDKYYIYRNNEKIDSTQDSNYTDTTTTINSVYKYQVTALFNKFPVLESLPSNAAYIRRMDSVNAPFYETFENPLQVFNHWFEIRSTDSIGWIIKTGGQSGFLDTAFEGSYNAHFYNDNMETSKLVSPKLNLSSGENFLLSFYIHMPAFNNDVHQLNVLYKKADSLDWKLIRSFHDDISSWEKKNIPLPELTDNYYIAFEAVGLRGPGVSIDSISIMEDTKFIEPQIFIDSDSICLYDSVRVVSNLDSSYNLFWDFGTDAIPQNTTGSGPHWVKYRSFGIKQISLYANDTYFKTTHDGVSVFDIPEKPTFTIEGNKLTSSSNINNQWYLNNEPIEGATGKSYIVEENGDYFVGVTNYAGCTQFSESKFIVISDIKPTIKEEEPHINIYPNPSNGEFTIEINSPEKNSNYFFKIIDITGLVKEEGKISSENNTLQITMNNINDGIYFLNIYSGQQSNTYKILIKK
ncbi:MAG: T9SS type A sorting domain-containing protein [Bacteroidota bacterium]